jgi:hypothetical protein
MKKSILTSILIILLFGFGFSQKNETKEPVLPVDQETKLITYSKIVDLAMSKDTSYLKGKKWFFNYYKNPTGVIKEEDIVSGKISGKHQFKILNPPDKKGIQTMRGIVKYSITTQYKENRARILLSNINLESTSYNPIEKWLDKNNSEYSERNFYYLLQIDSVLNEVASSFIKYMKEPNKSKKDEW